MQLFQIDRGLLDGVCADKVVLDLLPPGYGYHVVTFEINDNKCDNNSKFILEVRVDTKAEVEVTQFLSSFNQSSSCTFNLKNSRQYRRHKDGNTLSPVTLTWVQKMLYVC